MTEPIVNNLRPYKVKFTEYYFENNLLRTEIIDLIFSYL